MVSPTILSILFIDEQPTTNDLNDTFLFAETLMLPLLDRRLGSGAGGNCREARLRMIYFTCNWAVQSETTIVTANTLGASRSGSSCCRRRCRRITQPATHRAPACFLGRNNSWLLNLLIGGCKAKKQLARTAALSVVQRAKAIFAGREEKRTSERVRIERV